jgi:hypothetical protein
MPLLRSMRRVAGALLYDAVPFELRLRRAWVDIRNRNERITPGPGGRGARCEWRFTSELHIANVFPSAGARLMRRAFESWPVAMRDTPVLTAAPEVSFLIGHRGVDRLPHLLATLRSIAGQSCAAIECIVVEQSAAPEIRERIPTWVRYVHTPLPRPDLPYCRAWAFNVAARHARGRVLVLHDNDMLVPERYAAEALARVREGWAFADLKRFLFYVSEEETHRVFASGEVRTNVPATVVQNAQGGSIVAERDAYFAIGGFDESFIGWGGEDNDLWDRARTVQRVWDFGYLPLIHLHHPAQPGKMGATTAAVQRYREIESIPPRERIASLLAREQGRIDGPAV